MEAEIKRKWLWTNAKLISGQRCIIYFIEQTTKQVNTLNTENILQNSWEN